MLSRKDGRALAKQTLEGLNLFDHVFVGAPDSFGGKRTVALIYSSGSALNHITREMYEAVGGFVVAIFVPRDTGKESEAEDTLDELATAAMLALVVIDDFLVGQSDANPLAAARNTNIDGVIYRVERIPVTILNNT